MADVKFDDVTIQYPGAERPSVRDLDLHIADGEFLVLVGPSGCGKSTTLRALAGLEATSGGYIAIGGKDVTGTEPAARDIAMVFQDYALYPHMTVRENMGFALKVAKRSKSEIAERVDRAAEILGLQEFLDRKPKDLSGGQRQRVAMGRAIVREPQVFLMDEPLSNLDAKLRVQMRASLNQLHERLGVTTVYVTHDQIEAMTLGDRVAVLRDGRLQQVDTPKRLFDSPVNLFVAGFIGSPAMNFVDAEFKRDGEGAVLEFAGHKLPVPASLLDDRPGLEDYLGRSLILGIRPSDFNDAEFDGNGDPRIEVTAGVTEELGTEINVIFGIDAPPVRHEDATALAKDAAGDEADSALALGGDRSLFTARVSPRSKVKPGSTISLSVDVSQLHFFDQQSGLAIGHHGND